MTLFCPAVALPALAFAAGLTSWAPAILMIGGLIFLHELGHFLVAKWMGMPVEVFSLGFGPRLVGFRWRETDVRLSILPLGGYVKLLGFNPEDEAGAQTYLPKAGPKGEAQEGPSKEPEAEDPHGFRLQPVWKRQLFYSGGILFNVATTLVLMGVVCTDRARITGAHPAPSSLRVMDVIAGSAAAQGGVQKGDEIERLGTLQFPGATNEAAVAYIQARPAQPIDLQVRREGRTLPLRVVPQDQDGKGRMGISFAPSAFLYDRRPLRVGDLGRGILDGAKESAAMGAQVVGSYMKLFTFRANVKELGGPIAIARMGKEAARAGWEVYFLVTALISMNLAVLNALPIPFLDGGHMALLAFERLRGRDLSIAVKERILTGGFFLLISLMVLVFALDIWRLRH